MGGDGSETAQYGDHWWREKQAADLTERALTTLLTGFRDQLNGDGYQVKSSVPPELLGGFEAGVKANGRFKITFENAGALLALAGEFKYDDLATIARPFAKGPAAPVVEFSLRANRALTGVVAYLTLKCGSNVHENGIVKATSLSVADGSSVPKCGRPRI
jgi:hypothetical protein